MLDTLRDCYYGNINVHSLILFPEVEIKVGIILTLQMWGFRHSKAK